MCWRGSVLYSASCRPLLYRYIARVRAPHNSTFGWCDPGSGLAVWLGCYRTAAYTTNRSDRETGDRGNLCRGNDEQVPGAQAAAGARRKWLGTVGACRSVKTARSNLCGSRVVVDEINLKTLEGFIAMEFFNWWQKSHVKNIIYWTKWREIVCFGSAFGSLHHIGSCLEL